MASNTIIQIKRSASTATPTSLQPGELAYSYSSNNLFIGLGDGTPVNIGGVSTLVKLQAAYDAANAAVGGTAADGWAREQANGAFAHANSAYDAANTAYDHADAAYGEANSAYSYAGTVETYAQSGFSHANSAYDAANTAYTHADAAYGEANSAYSYAGTVETYAQSGFSHANSAYDQANTATTIGSAAYDAANTAQTTADAAFDAANNVVSTFTINGDTGTDTFATGGTLTFTGGDGVDTTVTDDVVTIDVDNTVIRTSGTQTIDGTLAITGDLVVSGNTVTQDVHTIVVEDSLIELAANNNISDALDIGLFGQYNDGTVKYTSFVRDASDGKYKLLTGGSEKPAAGNTVNVAAFSTGTLVADIEAGAVSTGTLTATGLAYLATPAPTSAFMYVDDVTGEVKYSYTVDGGAF